MWGADAGELIRIAVLLEQKASQIDASQRTLTARLRGAPWQGPAADRYRHRWEGSDRRQLLTASQFLRDAAAELRRNAVEQLQASRGDLGHGGGVHVGGLAAALLGLAGLPVGAGGKRAPESVARWWSSLSSEQQWALITREPYRLGALDGIPSWARDRANRIVIASELQRLKTELREVEGRLHQRVPDFLPEGRLRSALEGAFTNDDRTAHILKAKITALTLLQQYRGEQHEILLVETSGERVKAAVAIGNVDSATSIAVTVHGLNSSVEGSMAGYMADAGHLREMAKGMPGGSSTAAVVWMGYESPQTKDSFGSGSVASSATAETAARELRSFLEGLDVGREDEVRKVVIGHSYGSLVSGLSLEGGNHSVDAVIFQGSPGIGVEDVRDLGVPDGQVYVSEAHQDFVADLARFSEDPNFMSGVTVLETDATARGTGSSGHSEYSKAGSTSLYNSAKVVTGNTDGLMVDIGGNWGAGDVLRESLDPGNFHRPAL